MVKRRGQCGVDTSCGSRHDRHTCGPGLHRREVTGVFTGEVARFWGVLRCALALGNRAIQANPIDKA